MLRRITAGLGIGLLLVNAVRRLVAGVVAIQLARDGGVIAAVVTLLGLIGFIAAVGPVWRATSIDPTQALRSE
jgi:ABC-type antimicrobial peptide transport system permease subunit